MSTFTPEPDWIDVRGGAILPDGCEIQMDMTTGRQQARRADAGEATRQGHHAGDKISRVADSDEISRFIDALFRYSTEGTYVALHSFYHDPRRPPADARKHKLQSSEALIKLAAQRATYVANLPEPTVFAPPICTFASKSSAAEANLAEGLALSVECDAKPEDARRLLEGLLDRATIAVASGGTWIDPATGETHKKLHLHWRLAEPTREASDHQLLKRARRLAALLAESDSTAIPMVHPLRWPGTWHLKSEPILARIVQCDPDQEVHLEDVLDALEGAANMRGIPLDDQPHRTNANAPLAGDDDLAALARAIPNDAATYWESWNNTGMAFWAASGGSDAGFEAFDAWSAKRGEIYDAETTAARWQHWHTSPPTKLTIGKLVYLARQAKPDFRLPSWQTPKDEAEPSDHATAFPRDDWEQPLLDAVEELNVKHSVVTVGGQTSIATWEHNDALERDRLVFSREQDIKLRYRHRHFLVGFTHKGAEIWKGLGEAWLGHRNRRTYERVALIPKGVTPPGTLNLWRGFGVEPKAGEWPLIRQHLLKVICSGNESDYRWLVRWLARAVQNPELHAEVAVVLRGRKGTGKGTLGQILQRLFRHHAMQISNPAHFTGRFNGHMVDILFCSWMKHSGLEIRSVRARSRRS